MLCSVHFLDCNHIYSLLQCLENIKDFHHYTNSSIESAKEAVNAGLCLEDALLPFNTLTHIGEAIQKVHNSLNYYKACFVTFIHL